MEQGLLGFATLLIGLTVGRMPVELMVAPPVAQVRMVLDGEPVAEIAAAPWRAEVDFGVHPAPHRLEAFGLDGSGAEIAHAVQWVNLPRLEAELDLALERDAANRAVAVRLAWTTARPVAPAAVRAALDGAPLLATGFDRVQLPPEAGEGSHFLRVEVDFPGGRSAAKEIAFGGAFSEASTTSLTAVPVEVVRGRDPLVTDGVEASLGGAGKLRIAAVEKGAARVVVVIDGSAVAPLRKAAEIGGKRRGSLWGEIPSSCSFVADPLRSGDDEVLVFDPTPANVVRDSSSAWLFTVRARSRSRAQDLVGVLMRTDLGNSSPAAQALTNAVASAGLVAAAGGRRRAVILILGSADPESGDIGAAGARGLLERVDVPLRVWSPVAAVATKARAGWGPVQDVSTCKLLGRARETVAAALDRQRVVWVEGQHLPHEVVVASPRLVRAR